MTPIFFVSHFYESPRTGGERYNFEVVKYLKARGFDVRILVDQMMPKSTRGRRFLRYNLFYILKFMDADGFVLFTTDYMHPRLFLFLLFLKLFKDCRVLVLVHHLRHHEIESKILRFVCIRLESIFLMCADAVVAISEATKSEVGRLTGKDSNIFVVYPGLEQSRSEITSADQAGEFSLLFVGDCVRRKGLEYLVESLASLKRYHLHLHVVGRNGRDPTYDEQIGSLIEKNGLNDRVTFHGRVDGSAKRKLLCTSHVLILPSLSEGLPVIATRVGAIPELVKDGINGILVPPGDSQSLAGAISYLIDNPETREKYGKRGKLASRNFGGWSQVGERFASILEERMVRREGR